MRSIRGSRSAAFRSRSLAPRQLRADRQTKPGVGNGPKRLEDLAQRLTRAHEAAREQQPDLVAGRPLPRALGDGKQLRMDPPLHVGALDPEPPVPLLLAASQRVDPVEGPRRRLGVRRRERFPDEAADQLDADVAQARELLPRIVLVAKDDVQPGGLRPLAVLGSGNVEGTRRRDSGRAPELELRRPGTPPRSGQHERLVSERRETPSAAAARRPPAHYRTTC